MDDLQDPRELLRRSFAQATRLIYSVTPEQMALATPCTEFDVRTLIGHMLFAAERVASAGRREPISLDGPAVTGLADGDWAPRFEKVAEDVNSIWSAPDALEGEIELPYGTFPAAVVASIYALEGATHAWDLVTAVGSTGGLDQELAEALLPFARQILPAERRGDEMPFGQVIEVAAEAPAADRLAGFLGRRPGRSYAGERADLIAVLAGARHFLRFTLRDLTDEQARRRTTVSELTLAGILKHVTKMEEGWVRFIVEGPTADFTDPATLEEHANTFRVLQDETVERLLAEYEAVARATDDLARSLPDLDASQPLPEAPWNAPGARWTARHALLHIATETAHHSGHADIIREALDGQKTMG